MTAWRSGVLMVSLGAGLSALLASDAATTGIAPGAASRPVWTEVKWPFPLDEWGIGRAFRCGADTCGTDINLYLRAKVGFCNCSTGVADDAELDRVGDLEILSDQWMGMREGREIKVGGMNGRSRPYDVTMPYAAPVAALAIGFNDKCDVAVATVVADHAGFGSAERLAIDFLNSRTVLSWAAQELGS